MDLTLDNLATAYNRTKKLSDERDIGKITLNETDEGDSFEVNVWSPDHTETIERFRVPEQEGVPA